LIYNKKKLATVLVAVVVYYNNNILPTSPFNKYNQNKQICVKKILKISIFCNNSYLFENHQSILRFPGSYNTV
jgi:hypothetical protein